MFAGLEMAMVKKVHILKPKTVSNELSKLQRHVWYTVLWHSITVLWLRLKWGKKAYTAPPLNNPHSFLI